MRHQKQGPKPGAAKKWSERLKEIGNRPPPQKLIEILNQVDTTQQTAQANESKDKDVGI